MYIDETRELAKFRCQLYQSVCSVAADGRFQEDILQECELGLVAGPACADRCSVVQSRNIISDNYPHNARVTAHVSRVYMHTYHCTRVTMHTCLLWVSWPRLAPRHIGLTAAFCCCSALIWANLVLRPATTTISITIPPSSQHGVVP